MRVNRAGKPQDEQPFHREIEQHESGWWLPAQVGGSFNKWRESAIEHITAAVAHVRGRELAVQAGGHVGIWAAALAGLFDEVHTFEPDDVNWRCLERNTASASNVRRHKVGLGAEIGEVPWVRSLSNTGKHRPDVLRKGVKSGRTKTSVPIVTIDSLELPALDALLLDIEGFELAALYGGERTIDKFRPVILTEELGHAAWHGFPADGVAQWMRKRGYVEAERVEYDVIWMPT